MDWRKIAEDDLRHYREQKLGYEHTCEQIKEINAKIEKLSAEGKMGGDRMMDACAKRDKLILARDAIEPLVRRMDESLALMNEMERKILEHMYINKEKGALDRLCEELYFEKSRIYQIRNEALRKFTVAMYGVEAL